MQRCRDAVQWGRDDGFSDAALSELLGKVRKGTTPLHGAAWDPASTGPAPCQVLWADLCCRVSRIL